MRKAEVFSEHNDVMTNTNSDKFRYLIYTLSNQMWSLCNSQHARLSSQLTVSGLEKLTVYDTYTKHRNNI